MRAANGHPAPYGVTYFEVGNEVSTSSSTYVSTYPTFVQDMKASHSGILISCSTPSQTILTAQGSNINFIDPHYYTGNISSVDSDLTSWTQAFKNTPNCSQIKIITGEWNVTGGSWGLGRAVMGTLSCALLNANYLNVLMRHSDRVLIGCRLGHLQQLLGRVLGTSESGLGVTCQPAYYTMQLYANHAGTKTNGIPLTVTQPGGNLDVFACATSNYTNVALFVVNANTTATPFSFSFSGFSGAMSPTSAQTVCDTQNPGQPDMGNHWPSPNRVQIVPLSFTPNSVTLPPLSVTAIECSN